MSNKQTAITVNKEFYLKFKQFCDKNGYSTAKVVHLLMEQWLKEKSVKSN